MIVFLPPPLTEVLGERHKVVVTLQPQFRLGAVGFATYTPHLGGRAPAGTHLELHLGTNGGTEPSLKTTRSRASETVVTQNF